MFCILGDNNMNKSLFLPSRMYYHMQNQKQKGKIITLYDKYSKNAKLTELMPCIIKCVMLCRVVWCNIALYETGGNNRFTLLYIGQG